MIFFGGLSQANPPVAPGSRFVRSLLLGLLLVCAAFRSAWAADPSPAPPSGNQGLTAAQASGDIERAMVDAIQARRAYEANAKALERNAELVSRGA